MPSPADLLQEARTALRVLLRAPMLTAAILLTVGLGIGATTAIFAAVDAALLRPLPYAEPDRLVWIYTDAPPFRFRFSAVDYLALEAQQTQFESVSAYTERSMAFSSGSTAELLAGRVVSTTYFKVLGIRPALGRDFTPADGQPGSAPAVIVSHGFWQQRLGGRRDVIGSPVRLDGADYTLAGVLPAQVGPFERRQEFFVAARLADPRRRGPFLYTVIGRLRHGGDRAVAAAELHAINRRIFPLWRSSYQDDKATWSLIDLKRRVVGEVDAIAGLSLAAVALVWLIACTNASNLLVARVSSRRRELAVRAALGASRPRMVRHLFVESAWLAGGAALLGGGIAWTGTSLLRDLGAAYIPRSQEIALDGRVLLVLVALTLITAILFTVIPALQGTSPALDEALRGGRSSTGSRAVRRVRQVLVGAQFAVCTPLLVIAALLLVSLNALGHVDLGFDSRNVVTGSLRLPAALYQREGSIPAYWQELKVRLDAVPGVAGVAFADGRPPDGVGNFNNFDLEDLPARPGQSQPVTPWIAVTPEYFRVLGLTLLEGRLLEERDAQRPDLESVVVDRAWARRFFPGQSVIGKRFREGGCTQCPWTSVVGVVSEVKYVGLEQPDQGTVYSPMSGGLSRTIILRAHGDPSAVMPAVREAIRGLDANVPLTAVATIDELVSASLEQPRSLSVLVGAFAAIALALSVLGIYGVMAFYVQQHARDISIRMALGGTAGSVLRLVLRQGMTVVAAGIAAGLLAAFASTRLLASLLFGIGAADAVTFVGAAIGLFTIALSACLIPAGRATRLQPAVVLRTE